MKSSPYDERIESPLTPFERPSLIVGIVRLGILLFLTTGIPLLEFRGAVYYLLPLYLSGFILTFVGFAAQRLNQNMRSALPWLQVLLDFAVVAATVTFTSGPQSMFAPIFIVVVLESGLLLGMRQSFFISTMCALFMFSEVLFSRPSDSVQTTNIELWYNFLVQTLAYYLTTFMSGFWNRRLRQMQIFQREILDNMNSGFLICDASGVVTASNAAAIKILALPFNPVGYSAGLVLQAESGQESPIVTALRSGQDYTSYEFTTRTHDGALKILGLTTSRMKTARHEVTGIITSFTDLTEINRMREEIMRQDRMAVIGELAAGLAHEIRNPVAIIRGAADELSEHRDDPELDLRLRAMLLRESDQLNDIVSGFLDFAHEPSLKRERVDVRAIAREVSQLLERDHNGKSGTKVRVQGPRNECIVMGDASKIRQVFFNLGKNAIEAMEGRGTLQVVISGGNGDPVLIRFADEGPGISPDQMSHIFEPFYTTKTNGVGMGLAVCARIITAHDGTIRATSSSEGGCSMNVTLPSVQKEEI